jgi:hypothetical protein
VDSNNNFIFKKVLIGLIVIISISIFGSGCFGSDHIRYDRCTPKYSFIDQTKYDISPTMFTPDNIAVDTSGQNINPERIDRMVNELEDCLVKAYGNPIVLPPDVVKNGLCESNVIPTPLVRQCLVIKIPNDWRLSQFELGGSLQQILPHTNGGTCADKNLPDPNAVCFYRVAIQDNFTVCSTPSMYIIKDGIERVLVGCQNPWYAGNVFSECLAPSADPLDDGSGP